MMRKMPCACLTSLGDDCKVRRYFRRNHAPATLVAAMSWLIFFSPSDALAQGTDFANDRQFEVIVPAVGGVIQWNDVAESMAQSMTLDKDSVKQMLPTGSINLKSEAVMLMLLGVNLAFGDSLSIDIVRDAQHQSALRLRCQRDAFAPAQTATAKVEAKLYVDRDWNQRTDQRPLVLCIHGMKGRWTAFDEFRSHLRSQGFATAAVSYDYDQSIEESTHELSRLIGSELGDFPAAQSSPKIALVGHSLGGLIAREWVENSAINSSHVSHLFTVATPHGGSNWASLPPMLNIVTEGGWSPDDFVDVLLHQPRSKGLRDIRPHSQQLERMASRQRSNKVAYTTIIGTHSPASQSDLDALRDSLLRLDQDGSLVRLIRPRIKPLLESFDEIAAGKGDGVVSVENAKLAGVHDAVFVPLSHGDMFGPVDQGDHPVWQAIVERLSGEKNRVVENNP